MINKVQIQVSETFAAQKKINGMPVGLIIDESSHLKKSVESLGVSRQYAGLVGNVDNCLVAVYASLCNETSAAQSMKSSFYRRDGPKIPGDVIGLEFRRTNVNSGQSPNCPWK